MGIGPDAISPPGQTLDQDIRSINTSVGAAIGEILRTTLGPTGMDKMLVDSNGMVLITNNGKTLLGEMNINLDLLPAARMLKEVAMGQEEAVGDGTTTAVVLAGELLRRAEVLFDQGLHPTTVAQGYQLAAREATAVIADAGSDVDLDDTDRVEGIVRTAIAGTGGAQDEGTLASLIVEAAEELRSTGDVRWARLTVEKVNGGTVADSSLTRGIVFEGSPVHAGMPRLLEPARIACLDANLTAERLSVDPDGVALRPSDVDGLLELEAAEVSSKVDAIVDAGANVVFSEKSIDGRAQQQLSDRGVLAVRRMASDELEAVARATGARITDPDVVEPSDLGSATSVVHQLLGNDEVFSVVTEEANWLSLVLRGGTDQVLNEVERAARSGFEAVRALHQDVRTVPGGGAIEMGASLALREYASGVTAREQLAIEAFADALESVPRALAENAGLDPVDALVELRRRHVTGDGTAGVSAYDRRVDDVVAAGIVDPLAVKRRSVTTAADVVSRIVRIDDVLDGKTVEDIE